MGFRVDNNPVSRRQLYGSLIGVFTFVALAVESVGRSDVFRTRLEAFIVVAILWALFELFRTR